MWRKQLRQVLNPLMFLATRRFKRRSFIDDDRNIKDKKVFFKDEEDDEYLWCRCDEGFYTVSRLPFVNKGISLGDCIEAVHNEVNNKLYFERIKKMSGNSIIKIYLWQREYLRVTDELGKLKCKFLIVPQKGVICVSVPKRVNYDVVKDLLLKGEREEKCYLEYLCVRHKEGGNKQGQKK